MYQDLVIKIWRIAIDTAPHHFQRDRFQIKLPLVKQILIFEPTNIIYFENYPTALLSPRESSGGRYRCEMYAVSGCDCGRRKQVNFI